MEGNLNINLELTKEDMGQFSIEKYKNKSYILIAIMIFAVGNVLYSIIGWLLKAPNSIWSGIIIASIAMISPMFFIEKLLFKKGQENFEKIKDNFPMIKISMNNDAIYVNAGETRSKYEWKNVFGVMEYGSCFCILINKTNGMMIPKRLLEDNESQILRDLAGDKLNKGKK